MDKSDKPKQVAVKRDKKGRIAKGSQPAKGRPPGSKNSTTIFKEAIKQGFEETLQKDFQAVLNAVVKEAKKGNMQAAKILLDRAVPVTKAVEIDHKGQGAGQIIINVGSLEQDDKTKLIEATIVEEDER